MNTSVYCKICECRHNTKDVEFLDVEEDFTGRDLVTFVCHSDATPQKSLVYANVYED